MFYIRPAPQIVLEPRAPGLHTVFTPCGMLIRKPRGYLRSGSKCKAELGTLVSRLPASPSPSQGEQAQVCRLRCTGSGMRAQMCGLKSGSCTGRTCSESRCNTSSRWSPVQGVKVHQVCPAPGIKVHQLKLGHRS